MSYCLIFPGQGTQFKGMLKGLNMEGLFDKSLLDLMETGTEEELDRTINAQPAVFSVTLALWKQTGLDQPELVMGHSLGEYMALVAAGIISYEDAISLVKKRALYMDEAQPKGTGGMAAVIGLSVEVISEVINTIEDLWIANINGTGQVVISGKVSSIHHAIEKLKQAGARRVIPLKVEVASHCPMMGKAKEALRTYLKGVDMKSPRCPVIFNAIAKQESDPEKIKGLLADQLVSPVRWEESVREAHKHGIRRFIEIGPKSVLAPLVRRIIPEADVEVITVQ